MRRQVAALGVRAQRREHVVRPRRRTGCAHEGPAAIEACEQRAHLTGDAEARWKEVLETNVLGVFHAVRGALPAMQRARYGHIVLISSLSGRESYVGEPVYIASKWAIVGFGNSLRKEAARFGVKVTLIEPGLVDTPMARANPFAKPLFDAFEPLRPEDVAEAIAFVLSQPPRVLVRELAMQPLGQEI